MSKSKKNTVDPFTLIKKYGADATRWYLIANSPVWRPTLFDEEGVADVQRRFFSTLVNTYAFFTLYANVDKFVFEEPPIDVKERPEIDRWILSEMNSLLIRYRQWMDEYDVTRAARAVSDFTMDQLSNWYVRRNRRRFWKSEKGRDKTAAYQTLYECLVVVCKLTAPFAPFLADEIFRNLNLVTKKEAVDSVHLSMFPEPNKGLIDLELERRMEQAIKIVSLVRAMRMKANLKVRQPLKKLIIPVSSDQEKNLIAQMQDVILEEINVKDIEYVTEDSGVVKRKAKPNFKTLGPRFGKTVQVVAARIRSMTAAEVSRLLSEGSLSFSADGSEYVVSVEDVEILHEDVKGWLVESDGPVTVALDTELTQDLVDEGFAREFVNRVQNRRKDSGLEVTDRIRLYVRASQKLARALEKQASYVKQETLAVELRLMKEDDRSSVELHQEDVNGESVEIGLEKAN